MPVYVIDQWVDARSLGHDRAVRRAKDVVMGLGPGQIAEVIVAEPDSAADIAHSSDSRLSMLLETSHPDPDTFCLIIRHR